MIRKKPKRILLGVTGSIAAYKVCDLIRRLQERHFAVSVIMTREAEEFITPLTLSSLAGEEVYRDWFHESGIPWQMPHIQLAQDADVILIAPATAHFIGKLACGLADDLLSCTVLATRTPVFIAPAMNTKMYAHRLVQENCQKLRKVGYKIIEPVEGKLACGIIGEGHLPDIDKILKSIEK